jgi:hypothetical protein
VAPPSPVVRCNPPKMCPAGTACPAAGACPKLPGTNLSQCKSTCGPVWRCINSSCVADIAKPGMSKPGCMKLCGPPASAGATVKSVKSDDDGAAGTAPSIPIPKGWSIIKKAVCDGRLGPSAGKACVPDPTYPNQCIWPFHKAGYAPGAYAAQQCSASPGCKAVTCDAPGSSTAAGTCAARMQFQVTCDVSGYISVIDGVPPPPPPPFRLAKVYSDHMVLQGGPQGAHIWGYSTARSHVVASDAATGAKGVTTADAVGEWHVVLPYAASVPRVDSAHTLLFSSSLDPIKLNLTDVLFGDVW